jgi:hypothetical protein
VLTTAFPSRRVDARLPPGYLTAPELISAPAANVTQRRARIGLTFRDATSLWRAVALGQFPLPRVLAGGRVAWRTDDIYQSHRRPPT